MTEVYQDTSPSSLTSDGLVPWKAQEGPQLKAIQHGSPRKEFEFVDELFYGGAVGGGKSDFLLGDFGQDLNKPWAPHCRGILFRKTYGELEELISRSQEIYPLWFPGCVWHSADKVWTWPNGATLKMRYLESSSDWMRYWGHQYTWIGWDELPNWPDLVAYEKIKARLRSAHVVPNKRIRATGNPGGVGHHAVKKHFRIDEYPLGGVAFEEGGMTRMFVRSRLSDNKLLTKNDPNYINRLRGLSRDLVRALVDGDWDVVAGAFFDNFSSERHICDAFTVPKHWVRIRAGDWGSASPFAVLWAAVVSGNRLIAMQKKR